MANRRIEVEIVGDSSNLERSFGRASRSAKNFNLSIGTLVKSAVVFRAVREGMDAIGAAIGGSISEFAEQQKVAAQTNAALKSTGGAANVTAKHVDRLANAVLSYSGIDDEAVKAGANLLLTFKKVRNEAGKGNKIFDQATKAAVDLSVAGFGSISSTSKQLGKALQDPILGITALRRAGITFSESQKKVIKGLVDSGRLLEAQKIILKEVTSQVGGSARAFGQTIPGALARTSEAFKNMGGAIVGAVAPAVTEVANLVADAIPRIQRTVSDFVEDLRTADTFKAKIDVVLTAVGSLASQIADRIGDAVRSVDWNAVWANARGIADGFQKRLEEIDFGKVGERIGDGIAAATKRAIPAAKELAARISDAIAAIDTVALGKQLGPGLAAAIATAFVTLTDPAFWVKNWDLALAVGLTAFGGSIGRIAGKLAAPLARFGARIPIEIAAAIERFAPRIASAVLGLFLRTPQLIARALSPLTKIVARVFGRLGRISQFIVKVLGIQAAINAVVNMAKKIGGVFSSLGASIAGAFDKAWERLKVEAIRAALGIVEPFSHLPGAFGGWARDLKDRFNAQLDQIATHADKTARAIQGSIDGIEGKDVFINIKTAIEAATTVGTIDARGGGGGGQAAMKAGAEAAAEAAKAQAEAEEEAAAARKAAAARAAAARKAAAAAAAKAAAAAAKAAEKIRNAFDELMDSLDLQLDKAGITARFSDDFAALKAMENAVKAQIEEEGRTTELLRELFTIRQQRADLVRQQRNAKQFGALNLTDTGEVKTPSVAALKKRAGTLAQQIKGTVLDTPKTQAQLKRIAAVLSGKFGAVGKDVRAAILAMFNDIASGFEQGEKTGKLTKRRITAASGAGGVSAFGINFSQQQAALSTGSDKPLHIHLNLDGKPISDFVISAAELRNRRQVGTRAGRMGGTKLF